MKEYSVPQTGFPLEIAALIETVPSLQISSLYNDRLQQQSIAGHYTVVWERFDASREYGEVEIFDGKENQRILLTEGQYHYFVERPLHRHSYLEIMVVLSGSVRNQIEDTTFIYRAGQGCIMNMNIRHKEIPIENTEILFLGIPKDLLQELLLTMVSEKSSLNNPMLTVFLQAAAGLLESHIDTRQYWDFSVASTSQNSVDIAFSMCFEAMDALRRNCPGSTYLIRAAILRLLESISNPELFSLQNVSYAMTRKEFLVSKITFLIQASHGKITQEELEQHLSYHGDYLNRCFKEIKGISISAYRNEAIITKVKELLETTQLSVDLIMEQLHITSRGHFFRQFQKQTGMTPRQYRLSKNASLPLR